MSLIEPDSVAMLVTIASVIMASTPAYSAIVCPSLRLRRIRIRGMSPSSAGGCREASPQRVEWAPEPASTLASLDLSDYHDRALAVLGDGRWHHADDLRFEPRWFDSQVLTLVR